MDFTREPIIETVITPKEGCKLVVRSSKSTAQEEYFVDAVEVVSFGNALFYRTQERPKAFFVPATDYEILEVREARMVLKNVGVERTIKIGGGKATKESATEKIEAPAQPEPVAATASADSTDAKTDGRAEKRRDKRRHARRRRGREDGTEDSEGTAEENGASIPNGTEEKKGESFVATPSVPVSPPVILAPPSTLISETIARYKDNALFKGAFYVREELTPELSDEEITGELVEGEQPGSKALPDHPDDVLEAIAMQDISLEPSEFGTFGLNDEEKFPGWHFNEPEVRPDTQNEPMESSDLQKEEPK